jgi:hypothetical protein
MQRREVTRVTDTMSRKTGNRKMLTRSLCMELREELIEAIKSIISIVRGQAESRLKKSMKGRNKNNRKWTTEAPCRFVHYI